MRFRPSRRLLGLLAFLALGIIGISWLVATQSGLQFLWGRVCALSPVPMEADVRGRLIGPLQVERLRVDARGARVQVAKADLDWNPWGLLKGRLLFSDAQIHDLRITLHDRPRDPKALPPRISGVPLPVELRGAVHGLTVMRADQQQVYVKDIALDAVAGPRTLRIRRLYGDGYGVQLETSGTVELDVNGDLALETRWRYTPPQGETINGSGRIDGILARPHITQDLSGAMRAKVDASLVWLDAPFQWNARAKVAPVSLSRLHRPWRNLALEGQIRGEGGEGRLRGDAEVVLRDAAWGDWNIRTEVERTPAGWRLPVLLLDDRKGPARLALSGLLRADGREVALDASWNDLAWPWRSIKPEVSSPEGRLTVEGSLSSYRIYAEGALAREGLPGGNLTVEGTGDRRSIDLKRLELAWLDGTLGGQGHMDWGKGFQWQAELRGENINPGRLRTDWPGRVGGLVTTRGIRTGGVLTTEVALTDVQGELRGLPVSADAQLLMRKGLLRLQKLSIRSGEARLTGDGALTDDWDLRWALAAGRIQDLVPGLEGRVDVSGTVSGKRDLPRVLIQGEGHDLAWQGRKARRLSLDADVDLAGEAPWDARLDVEALALTEQVALGRLLLTLNGGPAQHRLSLDAAADGRTLHLDGEGRYAAKVWELNLANGRLDDPNAGVWSQGAVTPVRLSARGLQMNDWCWERGDAGVCFAVSGGASQGWQVRAKVSAFPAEALTPLIRQRDISVSGRLDGEANVDYHRGLNNLGLRLHAAEGAFVYKVSQKESIKTPYRAVELSAQADERGFRSQASASFVNGDHARAEFSLPYWRPGTPLTKGDQPLRGSAEAVLSELVWISVFAPEVIAEGRLDASLTIAGTVAAPMIQGGLDLPTGQLALPMLGISLKDVHLAAYAENETTVALKGSARSGKGQMQIAGRVTEEKDAWKLKAHVTGENVEVMRLPQAHVVATPDLIVEIKPRRLNLSGSLLLPKANIDLPEISSPVQGSSDVVVVDRKGEVVRKSRWTIVSQIMVRFGDEVRLTGYGLSGRLGGEITIVEPLSGGAVGRGEIEILEGKYQAYGQDLTIDKGRLLYGNSPLDNPGLDFRATREIDETIVGVIATGRLKKPEVRLYSEPAMDDSQVLAYLVLGRPIETASKEEADVLQHAALSLGIAGGTAMAREIAGQFGVDEVNVEGGTQRQDAALVLGKYLSPRLYIQYAVGLLETGNAVRVRYKLDKHWSLEAESGIQSGADILYTIEK